MQNPTFLGKVPEDCDCCNHYTAIDMEQRQNIGHDEVEFHYCPAHEHFKPNMHCIKHIECNDPIYR